MAKDDKKEVKKIENKEDKLKALDAAISHIEKQYGKGSVMKLGESAKTMNVDAVPTGCLWASERARDRSVRTGVQR